MADLFTIKAADIEFEIFGKTHKFFDAKIPEKIALQKEHEDFEKLKDSMSVIEQTMKSYEIGKKFLQIHLPSLTNEEIDSLGSSALMALTDKVREISEKMYGAVVEKVEKK